MVGSYVDFGLRTDRPTMDITDLKKVLDVCRKHKPQAIIHLAAEPDVDKCEQNPEYAYLVNSVGVYNVALAARELGVKMVYISTAGVFSGDKKGPYNEEDEPNPPNHYGHSKYLGELIVKGMLKNYIIARVDWIFGGGPAKDKGIVAKIAKQFDKPEIFGVNDRFGSPTFAKDLVAALKNLITEDAVGVFYLANKGYCSGYELVEEIVNILKLKIKVTEVDSGFFNLSASRGKNKALVSKIDLMRPWQEALKEYLETEWKPFLKRD